MRTSVPVDVTRAHVTGGSPFLPKFCRASIPADHLLERLSPSNEHSHGLAEVHVAMPTHDSHDLLSFRKAMKSTRAPKPKIAMERELKACVDSMF